MGITCSQHSPSPRHCHQLHPVPQGPPTHHSSSGSSTETGLGGRATLAAASGKGEEGSSPPCHPPLHTSERKVPRTPTAGAGKVSACHRQNQSAGNHPRRARVTSHPWERCRRGVRAVTVASGLSPLPRHKPGGEGHQPKSHRLAVVGESGQGQDQRRTAGP